MALKVRAATFLDVGPVEQLHHEAEARVIQLPAPVRLWTLVSNTFTAFLPLGQESMILVAEDRGKVVGFIQASERSGSGSPATASKVHTLQVLNLCIKPQHPGEEEIAAALIELLAEQAGERGVHRLVVRVPLDEPLLPTFRMHGFRQFATETVLLTERAQAGGDGKLPGARPWSRRDERRLYSLYRRVTPVDVARLEAPTYRDFRSLRQEPGQQEVVERLELVAWWRLHRGDGTRPDRLAFLAGPGRELAEGLADHALAATAGRPAWVNFRHYDRDLIEAFRRRGFTGILDQALLVRDATVTDRAAQRALVPSFG
ncbi:MAG: GNAT family N-acetyltransferase [Candidatus Dormibacteraeota bacterium]|nr:GNAT family N-acetyltransferase [Candidatus Dormibacteraeota bacterium]MBO0743944.1 GNAT family N-acetyltransferase [Candidatus Dormibacteraeota bacterium]